MVVPAIHSMCLAPSPTTRRPARSSDVSILVSGGWSSYVVTGTYTEVPTFTPSAAIPYDVPTIEAGVGGLSSGAEVIGFNFTSGLGPSSDDVGLIQWCVTPGSACHTGQFAIFGAENDGIIAADPIPEPSSIALLGAALGLFPLRRRASRRRGLPPSGSAADAMTAGPILARLPAARASTAR